MACSKYFVSSFSTTVELIVEGSLEFHSALREERFWYEFVPGFAFIESASVDAAWHVMEAESLGYNEEDRTITSSIDTLSRIVVIIEAIFEILRQQQALYTMHGSVIVCGTKAVALIGNLSGIGKTTLASYASRHGWRWIHDEKFTIHEGVLIGGTRGILNDSKTHRASPGIIPTAMDRQCPIALVCQPIVTTEADVTQFVLSPEKSQWVLYDEMTRDIRQVNGIVDPTLPVLSSYDTAALAEARVKTVMELTRTVPVVYLRGSTGGILSEMKAMLAWGGVIA